MTAAIPADRYRVERGLGQGGMATVYLADDVRHRRKVALKVLHPELSAVLGTERFLNEIELTASLQHPHILPLFDSGSNDGQLFYVMPFVEGETLRGRLERERQLPIAEALQIAREVLDALQYAHERGVIHRDIKPENILLQGGHALVADFGIALAVQQAGGQRMTQTGLSLGTPQYMAPEQAMGDKNVDARADIYALGAVTYEMLAGEPPFTGPTAQAIVAKVITEKPSPLARVRDSVPARVDAAIAQALAKLPADRPSSARELASALQNPTFTWAAPAIPAPPRPTRAASGWNRGALVAGTALALFGSSAAAWAWRHTQEPERRRLVALTLDVPSANPELARFGVSPDGARFAFATAEGLVVRDAGQREYRLFPGTQQAESPSFSPDGEWIAFQTNGHLRKIAVAGGSALALVPGDSLLAGRVSWGEDGSIAFESGNRLYLIPPGGGAPRLLEGARFAGSPRITPDGRGVLYVDERAASRLMYYDLATDSTFTVLEDASEGQYVPTGHIVYGHPNGGLFAVRFDVRRHTVLGTPVPIVPDAQMTGLVAPFVITRNGTLVYRAGMEPEDRLLMRDPRGTIDTLPVAPKVTSYARFSPDGGSLALTFGSARGTNRHTAIYDLGLGTMTRFTLEGGGHSPVWSPDGSRLAFTAEADGTDAEDIFVQPVDKSTTPVRITHMPNDQHGWSWPSDSVFVFASNAIPRGLQAAGQVEPVQELAARFYAADPLSSFAAMLVSVAEWFAGRAGNKIEAIESAVAMDPQNPIIHWALGYTYALAGCIADAAQHASWMLEHTPHGSYTIQLVSMLDAIQGRRDEALTALGRLGTAPLDAHQTFHMAESFAMAGATGRALDLLEWAVDHGFYPYRFFAEWCPFMAPLRGMPEFDRIVAKAARRMAEFSA